MLFCSRQRRNQLFGLHRSFERMVEGRLQQATTFVLDIAQLRFQTVAQRHQFFDFGNDAMLFFGGYIACRRSKVLIDKIGAGIEGSDVDPKNYVAVENLAVYYTSQGQTEKAVEMRRRSRELDPVFLKREH